MTVKNRIQISKESYQEMLNLRSDQVPVMRREYRKYGKDIRTDFVRAHLEHLRRRYKKLFGEGGFDRLVFLNIPWE